MKKVSTFLLVLFVISTSLYLSSFEAKPKKNISKGENCELGFNGSVQARKAVKLRTVADGANYEKYNDGNPITVAKWEDLVCELDQQIPDEISVSKPLQGIETKTVTIEAYILGAKVDGDNDIHAEISDSKRWRSDHIIIEVPSLPAYCDARSALWKILKDDVQALKKDGKGILRKPRKIRVTGYLFLDAHHGHDCEDSGGRGILKNGKDDISQVKGLYEIHPVLTLEVLD